MASIRSRIQDGFEVLGHKIYRHRFKTLGLMLLVTAAILTQLPKVGLDTSNESYFHEDDPTLGDYDAFREQFGREDTVVVAATPPDVFDRAFLEKLTAFHRALEERVPYVDEVTSLATVRHTRGEGDKLIVEDLLKEIPESPEGLRRLRERVLSSSLYPNFLISEDGGLTIVVVKTLAYSPGTDEGELLEGFDEGQAPGTTPEGEARVPLTTGENRAVVQAVEAVVAEFDGPDFPLHVTGGAVFSEFFATTMGRDIAKFLLMAFGAVGLLLLILFRRFTGVLLPMLVVFLALLTTVGLMAASGVLFTLPTMILPRFLLAVGVATSVHLLVVFFRHHREHGDREAAIAYALGHSGLPIVMTGLTTAAGMLSFVVAEMAPVAHLGIFAAIGMLIVLVYTLIFLPSLLAVWPLRREARFGGKRYWQGFDRLLTAIADFTAARPWSIVIVGAVILVLAIGGLFRLKLTQNFLLWLPETLDLRVSTELIDGALKGIDRLEVIVDTGEENGLYEPEIMNDIEALAAYAEDYRHEDGRRFVGNTHSVADILKETHQALNGNDPEFYAVPQDRRLIAQELLLFENSGSDDLENVVDSLFSKARLTINVPNDDGAVYVKFVEGVEAEAARLLEGRADVVVTGTLNLFTSMIHAMSRSIMKSYAIAAVVITLLMMMLVGSVRLGLLSMVANFFPILVTMGIVMGFAGIDLDISSLMLGSIALGLAVDDTIHFFHNFRRYYGESGDAPDAVRQTLLTSGRAMLFTTLVLVTGFWLFMFSTLKNNFNFGLLTGLTLIFALAADFLLAPALLILVTRTRYGRRLTERWSRA